MIEKRGYLNLARQFDESHPTVSAIAPLICFAVAFTLLILLRLVSIFGAVTARCVETDEFWYTSTGGNWPLVGSSILVLFLLFVWNVLIALDDWKQSKGTKVMVIVNAIGIAAMLYYFSAVHDSATFTHNSRAGLYDSIEFRTFIIWGRQTESECVTMRRFAGRWRVIDREVGYYGFNIPSKWIELKPWGYVYAQDASWAKPYAQRWHPPHQQRNSDDQRWRGGYLFHAPWDFGLQGDTLVLSSPDYFNEWERSTIVLQREATPELDVFPNPHAARR